LIKKLCYLLHRTAGVAIDRLAIARLAVPAVPKFRRTLPLIVSMTSYPARIDDAWIAIESILRQSVKPERFLLVLNLEEFPSQTIPRRIKQQTNRGLEVVWLPRNGRSLDKLLPALREFPARPVVTVDDDKIFPRFLLESLWLKHLECPTHIIGARGWEIRPDADGKIRFASGWERIHSETSGPHIHLPGGNGNLYPPSTLHPLVLDLDLALRTCPTPDDIWFWAAARKAGSIFTCLGLPAHQPVSRLKEGPSLAALNVGVEDDQFQAAIRVFSLSGDFEDLGN